MIERVEKIIEKHKKLMSNVKGTLFTKKVLTYVAIPSEIQWQQKNTSKDW